MNTTKSTFPEFNSATRLLSVREAAERLGVSIRHVHDLVKDRHVATVRLGRRLLFAPSDLEEFIASCRIPAADRN